MAKVKLACLERCSVAGIVYLPGPLEVSAEVAALILKSRPHAFEKAGSGAPESPVEGIVGDEPTSTAPEKRRKKPARAKRKG